MPHEETVADKHGRLRRRAVFDNNIEEVDESEKEDTSDIEETQKKTDETVCTCFMNVVMAMPML